jgi:hypothetical protein
VFVPFRSKNEIVPILENLSKELEGAQTSYLLHSTSLHFIIKYKNLSTQIEANVAEECKTSPLSTSSLAKPNNQLPRMIRIMSFDWALAHKLAAWNERELMRDLYDIYFIHAILDEMPNMGILKQRLGKIKYSKRVSKKQPKQMPVEAFLEKLKLTVEKLEPEDIESELRDYLASDELVGLDKKIKIGVKSLVEKILSLTPLVV